MKTILSIAGTDYDGGPGGRPAESIFDMSMVVSVEDEWSLEFAVLKCGAQAPYPPLATVALTTTDDDGSNPVLRFTGDVQRVEERPGPEGPLWGYSCTDLKHRARHVTLRAPDGSGTASYNLTPDDALYLYATAGRTVGQIIALVLTSTFNAAALNAIGVGAYTSLTPPTLPAATASDLAALTVVPREPVQLQGIGILNTLESLLQFWHPQYALWVQPDGVIRVRSIFGFTPATIDLPTATDPDHAVDWPDVSIDCSGCYTAVSYLGLDIQAIRLSLVDGTLSPAWTTAQQNAWTIRDFLQPKDASDEGTASGVTSTSATVHSDHATVAWITNFWQTREGWIRLFDPSATGIDIFEERLVTSCTAMSAGGTATISWDSSLPLARTGYTRYSLIGRAGPQALVSRKFHVREPITGNLDLLTEVGKRMYPRFPRGAWLANIASQTQVFTPTAIVRWSQAGAWPWFEEQVPVQIDPSTGTLTLAVPAVMKFADQSTLLKGYPADYAHGLPYDVVVLMPVNRGTLAARSPASGYSGTAYTKYGLQRELQIPLDTFTWAGDAPALQLLAAEHLAVSQDAVVEGSTRFYEIPAAFDPFTPGAALTFAAAGATTEIDGLALPVRSTRIQWHNDGPLPVSVSARFSNLKRPFQADSLYTHPAFGSQMFGMQGGDVFVAGMVDGSSGMMGMDDYGSAAMSQSAANQSALPTNALGDAAAHNPLAGMDNPLAGASNPLAAMSNTAPMPTGPAESGGGFDLGPGDFGAMDAGPGRARRSTPPPANRDRSTFVGPPVPGPGARRDPVDHPLSIANPSPVTPPIGKPINPDARAPSVRGPGLAARRGERTDLPGDDDTTSGGGG